MLTTIKLRRYISSWYRSCRWDECEAVAAAWIIRLSIVRGLCPAAQGGHAAEYHHTKDLIREFWTYSIWDMTVFSFCLSGSKKLFIMICLYNEL